MCRVNLRKFARLEDWQQQGPTEEGGGGVAKDETVGVKRNLFAENELKQSAIFGKTGAEIICELDQSKKKK